MNARKPNRNRRLNTQPNTRRRLPGALRLRDWAGRLRGLAELRGFAELRGLAGLRALVGLRGERVLIGAQYNSIHPETDRGRGETAHRHGCASFRCHFGILALLALLVLL